MVQYIREEYKKPFKISITTNGTLLTSEKIDFLKRNDIGLLLSIDGAKETQDYNRPRLNGEGSFEVLEKILPLVVSNFPNTVFRSTIIPSTCEQTFKNIMFAERAGFHNFWTVPNVFEDWTEDQKNKLNKEMDKYANYYIECYRQGKRPISFSFLEKSFRDILKINEAIKNNVLNCNRECAACDKCGLGASRFAAVHPNGNVYACQEMTSNEGDESPFYIGNIYSGILDNKRLALMEIFEKENITGVNCETCKFNRICDGGCVANNYLINKNLKMLPEMYCWWKQIILDKAIYIMQTLGNEKNKKFAERFVFMTQGKGDRK